MADDYVFQANGFWWFWDETWDQNGPYLSEESARLGLRGYIKWLETGNINTQPDDPNGR